MVVWLKGVVRRRAAALLTIVGVLLVLLPLPGELTGPPGDRRPAAAVGGLAPGSRQVVLTFDVDWGRGVVLQVLDELRERQLPAVFFVTGSWLRANPDLARRMRRQGHIVGTLDCTPDVHRRAAPAAVRADLHCAAAASRAVFGEPPRYFRPPAGTAPGRASTVSGGMVPVSWTVDAAALPVHGGLEALMRQSDGAGLILRFDADGDSDDTLTRLSAIITNLASAGYRFVPLDAAAPAR